MSDNQVQADSSVMIEATIDSTALSTEEDSICEYTFDDYYLDFFIASRDKTNSYKKACNATGYTLPAFPPQAAFSYHKRLDRDGMVREALSKLLLDDQIASRNTLNDLRTNSDSDNIKLQAAKHQSGDLYSNEKTKAGIEVHVNRDNVTITHKNQSLKIESTEED